MNDLNYIMQMNFRMSSKCPRACRLSYSGCVKMALGDLLMCIFLACVLLQLRGF